MRAVIMAGGEGTRLRPLTISKPKPMVSVINKPMMEYIIELLKAHNIFDIHITLRYMPNEIINYFKDGSDFGVKLHYFKEDEPLGTAGSVKNATKDFSEDFLVISGDCLTDINLSDAINFHKEKQSYFTLVLSKVNNPCDYGIVVTDQNNKIVRFLEKPTQAEAFCNTVNTGIYIINKEALNYIKENEFFDFSKDLFPILLTEKKNMLGYISKGYWCDIGNLKSYLKCQKDILNGEVNVKITGSLKDRGVILGENSFIEVGASITPPVYIGENSYIEAGSEIGSYSVLGSSVVISKNTKIEGAIVNSGSFIGKRCEINNCILDSFSKIKDGGKICENAVIGSNSIIGANTIINSEVKIWCDKKIGDGEKIKDNIIHYEPLSQSPFGEFGMEGEAGVEFSPYDMLKIGECYSSMMKNGKIAIACDEQPISYMMKNALMSGVMASGGKVYDFGTNLIGIVRSAIDFYHLSGGIYIGNKDKFKVKFLDSDGSDISRKKETNLEQMLRCDYFIRSGYKGAEHPLNLTNYNSYYYKVMANRFYLKKINRFLYFNKTSNLISEYITNLTNEIGIHAIELKENCHKSGEINVKFSNDLESFTLYTEMGKELKEDTLFMLLTLILVNEKIEEPIIIQPYISNKVTEFAKSNGLKAVISKSSPSAHMKEILKSGNKEQFLLTYDFVYAISKILEFLSYNSLTLDHIVETLPEIFKISRTVELSEDIQAKIMGELLKEENNKIEVTDGIKILSDKGWIFISPFNNKPAFKITAEGLDYEYATELCDFYERKCLSYSKKCDIL